MPYCLLGRAKRPAMKSGLPLAARGRIKKISSPASVRMLRRSPLVSARSNASIKIITNDVPAEAIATHQSAWSSEDTAAVSSVVMPRLDQARSRSETEFGNGGLCDGHRAFGVSVGSNGGCGAGSSDRGPSVIARRRSGSCASVSATSIVLFASWPIAVNPRGSRWVRQSQDNQALAHAPSSPLPLICRQPAGVCTWHRHSACHQKAFVTESAYASEGLLFRQPATRTGYVGSGPSTGDTVSQRAGCATSFLSPPAGCPAAVTSRVREAAATSRRLR